MATVQEITRRKPSDVLDMPNGRNVELIDGQLVEQSVSVLSSLVAGTILAAIVQYARDRKLGLAWGPDIGLVCFSDDPNRLRRPDVAFIRMERITSDVLGDSFLRIAPDLVVEVISPHDGAYELERKIQEYLAAGVELVWIVHPEQQTVRIHRADGTIGWLTESGALDGERALPGFRFAVRDLFPPNLGAGRTPPAVP